MEFSRTFSISTNDNGKQQFYDIEACVEIKKKDDQYLITDYSFKYLGDDTPPKNLIDIAIKKYELVFMQRDIDSIAE